jgi:hypothetical protein
MVAMQMARQNVTQRIWIYSRRKERIARAHGVHTLILLCDPCGEHPRLQQQIGGTGLHMEKVERLQQA